ncbi:sugar ABC transporter ATP-binding protein [soil metagenome]
MRFLPGVVTADPGRAWVGREPLPSAPRHAISAGISVIYQELTYIPDMSVVDNVMLGQTPSTAGFVRKGAARRAARAALDRVGLPGIDLSAPLRGLTLAQRQLVEIARCLVRDARVLVFDEPTSSLPEHDVTHLLETIRGLKRDGLAILYVSHHLSELFEIADEIVVMRDGTVVASRPTAEWTESQLVSTMLAKDLKKAYPWVARTLGETVLDVQHLHARNVNDSTISVREREIVGLVGLDGAGRTELLKAIAGVVPVDSGEVRVDGVAVRTGSLAAARRAGIIYAPEDRKSEGLILSSSTQTNVLLGILRLVSRAGVVDRRGMARITRASAERFGIRVSSPGQRVDTLSGGNQQKVILARTTLNVPRVVLLDDPTRGVDVGAKSSIYENVLELADSAAIILASSDTDEVLAMADRVYVLRGGRIVAELTRDQFDREQILALASTTVSSTS